MCLCSFFRTFLIPVAPSLELTTFLVPFSWVFPNFLFIEPSCIHCPASNVLLASLTVKPKPSYSTTNYPLNPFTLHTVFDFNLKYISKIQQPFLTFPSEKNKLSNKPNYFFFVYILVFGFSTSQITLQFAISFFLRLIFSLEAEVELYHSVHGENLDPF